MYITIIYKKSQSEGDYLLVIENVPVVSCPRCGDSYLTAETLYEIECIKLHRSSWAQERKVLAVKGFEVRRGLIRAAERQRELHYKKRQHVTQLARGTV